MTDTPTPYDHDNVFGGINRLAALLPKADERGLILALSAFAEETLGVLLQAYLAAGDPARQLLEGFNAPLGTLSARIKAAFAMGLVTKDQYDDLERMRKIRNAFSHSWEPVTFADPGIAGLVTALNFSNIHDTYPESAFDKVRSSLGDLVLELQVTASRIEKEGLRTRTVGTRLWAGLYGSFEDQIASCLTRFKELQRDLPTAVGERRRFLLHAYKRWDEKLARLASSAPAEFRARIDEVSQFAAKGRAT